MSINGREPSAGAQGEIKLASHRLSAAIGLIVAFGWTYLLTGRSRSLTNIHEDIVTIVAEWAVVLVLGIIVFAIQKRSLGAFGVNWFGWHDMLPMFGALLASYVVIGVVGSFVSVETSSLDVRNLAAVPFAVKLGIVLTAGICEEFMYRGFGIEELAGLTGSLWLGGLISWVAFTFAHIDRYGFTTGLVIPAVIGAFLTLLYVWRRNLPVCMLMHSFIDGFSIFIVPMLMTGGMRR